MIEVIRVGAADADDYLENVRALFREYADSLGFDLRFQDFDRELARLPGEYAPPDGCLLIALRDGQAVGSVALRKLGDGVCEMKRLYVRPFCRSQGIGGMLAAAIVKEAVRMGYTRMRLDTVPAMAAAQALYVALGFVEIDPYRYNPIPGAKYMELVLVNAST